MFRLPDNAYQYKRSFSAHFKSLQKPQLLESRIFPKKSSESLIRKRNVHQERPMSKSEFLQGIMKKRLKDQQQKKEISATPSARALYEQKLIPPCGTNFQYYISENSLLDIVNSRRLIEPKKILSHSLRSRPITPTQYENDFKKYPKEYKVARKNSARRKFRKNESKVKGKKNELMIEPWEIRQDLGDFIEAKK